MGNVLSDYMLFINVESLIRYGGLLIVCLVVFASTGLFFCFFLPSGAVLFTAGVFAANGGLPHSIFTICVLLVVSSVTGCLTGYAFGRRVGPLLYRRQDSRLFRQRHLAAATSFYNKHGRLALIAGFFLPIIRTFAPIVAGMIRLSMRRFAVFSVIGSIVWILGFTLSGYFIGSRPILKPWINYIVVGFIMLVTVPLVIRIIRGLRN